MALSQMEDLTGFKNLSGLWFNGGEEYSMKRSVILSRRRRKGCPFCDGKFLA
jgi:hypothetical protein